MKLHRVVAGLFCALLCTSAAAAPITYDFAVRWTGGPLAGQIDTGGFVLDGASCGPAYVCTGVFSPGNAVRRVLDFWIEVDGRGYREEDDLSFPSFPQISFSALGVLTNIDYDGLVGGRELVLFGGVATYFPPGAPAGPLRSFGLVTLTGRTIPEPASLALLSTALLTAAWAARRRGGRRER